MQICETFALLVVKRIFMSLWEWLAVTLAPLNIPQDEPVVHVLYPLMYMHGIYSNMIDKVYRHMEVSWSFFMQADNGQLVVVRSQPHTIDFVSSDIEGEPGSVLNLCITSLERERDFFSVACWTFFVVVVIMLKEISRQ